VVPGLQAFGLWHAESGASLVSEAAAGEMVLLLVARAAGLAVLAATLALVALVLGRRLPAAVTGGLLAAALFADLTLFGWRYLHAPFPAAGGTFADPATQFAELLGSPNLRRLSEAEGVWRVAPLGRDAALAGNAGYLFRIPLAIGLDPLLPRRYAELVALMNRSPVSVFENLVLFLRDSPSPLWPLLNARYRLVPRADPAANVPASYRLEEDGGALPRAFLVHDVRAVPNAAGGLESLASPDFDPRGMVVLEVGPHLGDGTWAGGSESAPGGDGARMARSRVQLEHFGPGDILATASVSNGGVLVVLEAWHPGWTAVVNGVSSPIYPANHAFMGVLLPPGDSAVHFQYAPSSWRVGLAVAGATIGALGMAAALRLRKRPGRHDGVRAV
jgi:hypothetical protein